MKHLLLLSVLLMPSLCAAKQKTKQTPVAKPAVIAPQPVEGGDATVPPALKPWVGWVLRDAADYGCPFENLKNSARLCVFPSSVKIDATQSGARFEYSVHAARKKVVSIIGDKDNWPSDVTVAGRRIPVVLRGDHPAVMLERGSHVLQGVIPWRKIPDVLRLPDSTAVIELSLNGQTITDALIEDNNLRLAASSTESAAGEGSVKKPLNEGGVEIKVFRMLKDGVPALLETRVRLNVSNIEKELSFGPALPDGFVVSEVQSPLPLRFDAKNRLQIIVKPGEWDVVLTARHKGPLANISLSENKNPLEWPQQEIWVFQANPSIRRVTLDGVPTIDPSLSEIPDDWRKGMTAFKMSGGVTLTLRELQRGFSQTGQESLTLRRNLSLDFSGQSFSSVDSFSGRMTGPWRIEASPGVQLGRITINNSDVLITKGMLQKTPGVEIRNEDVNVRSESLIAEGAGRFLGVVPTRLPLAAWDRNFQSISANLNLPPAWTVFAVWGADQVSESWLGSWSLWNVFVLLLCTLSVFRLYGRKAAIIAFVALLMALPAQPFAAGFWLNLLVAVALARFLPAGRLQRFFLLYRTTSAILLGGLLLLFSIAQLREAVHPVLRLEADESMSVLDEMFESEEPTVPQVVSLPDMKMDKSALVEPLDSEGFVDKRRSPQGGPAGEMLPDKADSKAIVSGSAMENQFTQMLDTSAIQTGPGIPNWKWKSISMSWQGPVNGKREVRIWFIPPYMNRIANIVRVIFMLVFFATLLTPNGTSDLNQIFRHGIRGIRKFRFFGTALVALAICSAVDSARAETAPSREILEELKENLLRPPACLPNCATISKMRIEHDRKTLRMRMEIHAQNEIVLPLFSADEGWRPTAVRVNGNPSSALNFKDGRALQLWLGSGVHDVLVEGTLPDQDVFSISFASVPRSIISEGSGWKVEGLRHGKLIGENLQLQRIAETSVAGVKSAEPAALPQSKTVIEPLLQVERRIFLDKSWRILTTVSRLTKRLSPVAARIPLLAGESVSSAKFRSEKGFVLVSLDKDSDTVSWSSSLEKHDSLTLKAPDNNGLLEKWIVFASPLWNVSWEGISPVEIISNGRFAPMWKPWPSEEVVLRVTAPDTLEGPTITALNANLDVRPGARITETTFAVSLRSSKGLEHPVELPSGINLLSAHVYAGVEDSSAAATRGQGREIPLRIQDGKVIFPVSSGVQTFVLKWSSDERSRVFTRSPKINLGLPLVNLSVNISQPEGRWIAFLGGPSMGPVVQFWGLFLSMVLISLLLSRVVPSPLGFIHWLLLAVGMIPVDLFSYIVTALFFVILAYRHKFSELGRRRYNFRQALLFVFMSIVVIVVVRVLGSSFLGSPDMRIAGNDSNPELLKWYTDRVIDVWPRSWVVSFPDWVYRGAMLGWALWFSSATVNWSKWIWSRLTFGAIWIPKAAVATSSEATKPDSQ